MTYPTSRRLAQRIDRASGLEEALALAVRGLKELLVVDVCSIYLGVAGEPGCVLRATDGLEPQAVGKLRFAAHEGLVGTVFGGGLALAVDDVEGHAQYRPIAPLDEHRYRSFLGVPLRCDARTLGVLSVRQGNERVFGPAERQALEEVAAALAPWIRDAVPGEPRSALDGPIPAGRLVVGIGGAPGLGLGVAVLPSPAADFDAVADRVCGDVEAEEAAFVNAVGAVRAELRASGARLASVVPIEAHALFRVYAELLDDEDLFADAIRFIRAGSWAPGALRRTIAEHSRAFDEMDDPYLRARGEDLRGLGRRVLLRLQSATAAPRPYPEQCILVGDEVSIARIADVPTGRLKGIVCLRGSRHSHAAMLARSLKIPAVMGVGALSLAEFGGRRLLVDGQQGQVVIDPAPPALEELHEAQREERRRDRERVALREQPARMLDGAAITLQVNLGLPTDLAGALDAGAEGVGLYRSEFAFMVRDAFPDEAEQTALYREVLRAFAPAPVTMRTLDAGSDKALPYFPLAEDNPALGWRGIRLTLDNPGIFLTQLRAMLRANEGLGNLRLLLPMVNSVGEVDAAGVLIDRACAELRAEGLAAPRPQLGVMLEVPAALYQLEALARRADFFSFGTNDLTQYLLAVDRGNPRVAARHDALHPAVLRALRVATARLRELDRPVGVCGDMAGDPLAALLLVGMGVRSLSMAAPCVPVVKQALRGSSRARAGELVERAVALESPDAVRRLLAG